jgi:catechol 2,3-dioxygenase
MNLSLSKQYKSIGDIERTISMGMVSLHVKDIPVMKRFYNEVLLLDVIHESDDSVTLGHTNEPLVELLRSTEASYENPTHAGLYHLAILYTSRQELSKTLIHIFTKWQGYFVGSADHLVSEAFYFTDPEGNGIELYFDKEKTLWQWENGSVKMASLYIDPISYIQTHHGKKDAEHVRTIGHVHLKVGDISEAKQFYVEVLGFDITAELPGALFLSRDGYHHHLGMNSWESSGAKKRTEPSGLKSFEMRVHSQKEFESMQKNLITHAIVIAKNRFRNYVS